MKHATVHTTPVNMPVTQTYAVSHDSGIMKSTTMCKKSLGECAIVFRSKMKTN